MKRFVMIITLMAVTLCCFAQSPIDQLVNRIKDRFSEYVNECSRNSVGLHFVNFYIDRKDVKESLVDSIREMVDGESLKADEAMRWSGRKPIDSLAYVINFPDYKFRYSESERCLSMEFSQIKLKMFESEKPSTDFATLQTVLKKLMDKNKDKQKVRYVFNSAESEGAIYTIADADKALKEVEEVLQQYIAKGPCAYDLDIDIRGKHAPKGVDKKEAGDDVTIYFQRFQPEERMVRMRMDGNTLYLLDVTKKSGREAVAPANWYQKN